MKIYKSVTIDIETGQVEQEDSFEYFGDIIRCSGGGGSSGSIDYPTYLKNTHQVFIEAVLGTWRDIQYTPPAHDPVNPYDYMVGPNTSADGYAPIDSLKAYETLNAFSGLDFDARFKSLIDPTSPIGLGVETVRVAELRAMAKQIWDEIVGDGAQANRDAIVAAHAERTLDILESTVIPKVELGMRQANMGLSTGFVIGKALIYDGHNKDIKEFSAKLEEAADDKKWELYGRLLSLESQLLSMNLSSIQIGLQRLQLYVSQKQTTMATAVSLGEAYYQHEQKYQLILTDKAIREITWKIETANHVGKAIAAIAGASTVKEGASINAAASTLSGAASGAAAGAMVGAKIGGADSGGGWYGAAIGAVVGGIGGYLSSQK